MNTIIACFFVSLGVGDDTWWSLKPVREPAIPKVTSTWVRNPIDAFVLENLKYKGFEPSPIADRRTLIRRVHFDLLGLPPASEDVEAFERDPDPAAYEKLVRRLLASPHYGERWARHWMDVIHYAETHGHDQDVPRDHAWPYRDYLIQSFNADKPYARFVEEQIAGDVLFPDDPRAAVALGMLAAGPWDESSLRDIREDSIDRLAGQYLDRDDMVTTVGLAFLSTTVQCARCHDHKFDPVSIKEYYGLQAIFAGVDRANRAFDPDPLVHRQRQILLQRKRQLETGRNAVAVLLRNPKIADQVSAWERRQAKTTAWEVVTPLNVRAVHGSSGQIQGDGSILFEGARPERDTYIVEFAAKMRRVGSLRLEVLSDPKLPKDGPGRQDNGNLHLSEIRVEVVDGSSIKIARALADFNQEGWSVERAIDGKKETAWGIYPQVGKPHSAVFVLDSPVDLADGAKLRVYLEQQHGGGHLIGRPRLSVSADANLRSISPIPASIDAILAKPPADRTATERVEMAEYALKQEVEDDWAALPAPKLVFAATRDFVPEGSFRPAKGCRPIHVLKRGDIKRPGELAQPAAPDCIESLPGKLAIRNPEDEGQRRAAFAKWVSDLRNPLTWRAIVNRVWHYHFGRGIVATPSDLGRMGATPTHPELLDWLTTTFQRDGGSLKSLHYQIVTSATYMQNSRPRPNASLIDADNTLLWRMNATRLDAESVRDAALVVAGRLDRTMGGPSMRHFAQSPGIHRTPKVDYHAFDVDSASARRRSVYRFVFRTVPDPFLDALDCPDASQFTAVRPVSVTALQALAMLNDSFMVKMSEHFARRVENEPTPVEQVRRAYRLALSRPPTEREESLMVGFVQRHGLANACRVLLNSNEFVFVD